MTRQSGIYARSLAVKDEDPVNCCLCQPNELEVRMILKNCVVLMIDFSGGRFSDKKTKNLNIQSDKYRGSLQKLLRFLFFDKFSEGQTFNDCQHVLLYNYYKTKTGFDKRQIDILAEEIYEFQAKRNYQLQVLNTQVKCYPKTIYRQFEDKLNLKQLPSQVIQPSKPSTFEVQPQQHLNTENYFQNQLCTFPMCTLPTNQVAFLWNTYVQPQAIQLQPWSFVIPFDNK